MLSKVALHYTHIVHSIDFMVKVFEMSRNKYSHILCHHWQLQMKCINDSISVGHTLCHSQECYLLSQLAIIILCIHNRNILRIRQLQFIFIRVLPHFVKESRWNDICTLLPPLSSISIHIYSSVVSLGISLKSYHQKRRSRS